ncbi:YfeC-like transcriptional regulator [Nocardioides rubriscoriae]|uniref:YfeC-like transcriptional regulator n=1 Tax=Nocardioides rubriscoriae TaxID=642762 RepID=UPI0011DFAE28
MDDFVTPRQLAEELGLSDRTVRQWLRDQGWQGVPYTRWRLTEEQAAQVRNHFRRLG